MDISKTNNMEDISILVHRLLLFPVRGNIRSQMERPCQPHPSQSNNRSQSSHYSIIIIISPFPYSQSKLPGSCHTSPTSVHSAASWAQRCEERKIWRELPRGETSKVRFRIRILVLDKARVSCSLLLRCHTNYCIRG